MEKTSFLMYLEYEEQLTDLSDEELGKLIRAIFTYEKSGIEPKFSGLLKMAFAFIKGNLNRDRQKYDKRCVTSAINGSKGGRPKEQKPNSKPNEKPKKPKKADIEIENEIDIVNENENENVIDIVNDNDNEIDITVSNFFEEEFGYITPTIFQKLTEYQKEFDDAILKQAIKICVFNNVRTISYLEGVLNNFKGKGITTYSQYLSQQSEKDKDKREPIEVFDYDWLNENESEEK